MQAPSNSRVSAAAAPEASPILVRMLIALVATVTLLFLYRPAVVHAQEPVKPIPAKAAAAKATDAHPASAAHAAPAAAPVAHTPAITTGSAQGALADQTSGKGDAAPKEPVKAAPRAVRPTTTRAANAAAAANAPKAEAAHTAPKPVTVAAEPAETEAEPFASNTGLSPATRMWGPDYASLRSARGSEQSTVFISHALDAVQADVEVEALLPVKKPHTRSAEYAGAPFAVSTATLIASGMVGVAAPAPSGFMGRATAAVRRTDAMPKRVLLLDEIEITLPAGTSAEVGARFVTVDAERLVKSTVQIAVPTGVLEVVTVEEGRATIARVVQQTGRIEEGQRLLPLEGKAVTTDIEVTAVPRSSTGPETEVLWVNGDGLLPSLQSFLVLSAGEREGVKAGDVFALVKRQGLGPDAVELRVASVRVVRVTAFGSTAIVVRQDQPGIAVGGAARLIGRVQ